MTPSNPDNNQPLILRIADALGVLHLVAPAYHTHSKSEVSGLENTLGILSHQVDASNNTAYGQVKVEPNETDGKVQISIAIEDSEETDFLREAIITWSNIKNFIRALLDPDTTPTMSSDKLVTSGGVATALESKANASDVTTALANKMDKMTIDSTPSNNADHIVSSKGVYDAIDGLRQDTDHYLEGKMDNKTIDSTPSNNANNLVSSKGVYDALALKADDVNVRYNEFEKADTEEVIDLDEVFGDDHMVSHFILQNLTNASCNISDFFTAANANILDNGETVPQYAFAIVKVIMYDNGSTVSYFVVVDGIYEM